jgi:hypothetical protein
LNDRDRNQIVSQLIEPSVKEDDILPFVQMFVVSVQEKIIFMLFEKLLPIFITPHDSENWDNISNLNDSIADSISKWHPVNKAKDLEINISDALYDLLTSVKLDLESDTAKKVLNDWQKNATGTDIEFSALKDKFEKKHCYSSIAIKEAHQQLLPVFINKLDALMEELCDYIRQRTFTCVEEMLLNDRENLPGPQHLE